MIAYKKKKVIISIGVIIIAMFNTNCSNSNAVSIERKIDRIESGLRSELNDPFWKRMDISARMDHFNVPGVSISVINDYQIEWTKGYGILESGSTDPVTPDTLFQMGSIGKVIVAVTTLQCVEQEILDLDSDVNEVLVSWHIPNNQFTTDEKVTLRRLLSHSAGVTVGGFRGYSIGEEIPNIQQILDGEKPANSDPVRVFATPGTQYSYSGGGYMIVQQLLEDVFGKPLSSIIETSVLEPGGMTSTTFVSPLPENLWGFAASGHRADGLPISGGWHTYPEAGSGASGWSTSSDLARFTIQLMKTYQGDSNDILSPQMAVLMMTPQMENRGLGPVVLDDGGDRFYFLHPGGNDGYQSIMVAYPERGQGIVILTNGDNGSLLWREILNSVSIEYRWVQNNTVLYSAIFSLTLLSVLAIFIRRRQKAFRQNSVSVD